jgi:DNA primase
VPEEDVSPQDRERAAQARQKQTTLTEVLEKAGEAYRKHLKSSPQAIAYFKNRGLSGEIARQFGLGYAPDGWRSLASVFPDYQDPLLVESGLVITQQEADEDEKRYDRFRDRVMFPIRNIKGECIGFGGRVLGDGTPKYLNSPETPVFSKGRELYGLFEARQAMRDLGYALVTEGYMDVVALSQLGFANAVATLGTACTGDHIQKLFRFTDNVVFAFDGDSAGRRAAKKALDGALSFASDVRSIKFLFLPSEHDPDSYIRTFGKDAFAHAVTEAVPLSRMLIEVAREGCDLLSAEGRAHLASNAKPMWMALPDGALKRQLLGEIASLCELGTNELQDLWIPPTSNAKRSFDFKKKPRTWARGTRQIPAGRADHAARVLLSNMEIWQELSGEDHDLLCSLALPHGPLFVWIDHQHHEHGNLSWAALLEGLRGHECEPLATRVMSTSFTNTVDDSDATQAQDSANDKQAKDARQELQSILQKILLENLDAQMKQAIESSQSDPTALTRYKALYERRKQIGLNAAPAP